MEDTKELAKATDQLGPSIETFDNTFPWLSEEEATKTTEEPMCADSASCDDLITRITDEHIEGEELMSEAKENWWVKNDDGINWEWMFPTTTSKCIDYATNDNQEVSSIVCEPNKVEEPLLKAEDHDLWENIEGVNWDWINPFLNNDSDNDGTVQESDDDAQPSHVTFDNRVGVVQGTFQELNSDYRGDIRSPSEVTPISETNSGATISELSESEKLRIVRSISKRIPKASKCPFLLALDKISSNNASQNSSSNPDLHLSLALVNLAMKLQDLVNDINALVGRLAVESPSDAWIESIFSTTRSEYGSLECKSSLSSNASSASKEHEKNASRDGSWDGSER